MSFKRRSCFLVPPHVHTDFPCFHLRQSVRDYGVHYCPISCTHLNAIKIITITSFMTLEMRVSLEQTCVDMVSILCENPRLKAFLPKTIYSYLLVSLGFRSSIPYVAPSSPTEGLIPVLAESNSQEATRRKQLAGTLRVISFNHTAIESVF